MALSRRVLLGRLAATGAAAAAATAGTAPARAAAAAEPDRATGTGPTASTTPPHPTAHRRVHTGFDHLSSDGYRLLDGERVGIVTNPTGVTHDVRHIVDVMHADPRVRLTAVFGPEHGFRGTAQAGGSEGRYDDPATGLPVYDTYDKTPRELQTIFTTADIDTILFDIQDVGARFYTYIWTLYDCMVAAALAGKRFVVLDRPNPVTGRAPAGPVLDRRYASFIGREPIAQTHGMTVAELALLFNGEFVPTTAGRPVHLETVRMTGWHRTDFFDETGLPWVPPSPNMPTPDTALVYAGTCLFEGTNLSEGRGTTRPFELLGADGLDRRWSEAMTELALPGVHFREAYFAPTFSKFQGKTIGGLQLHIHDRTAFDPVRTGIALLTTARRLYPSFTWLPAHFDHLTGTPTIRTLITAGADPDTITTTWQKPLRTFRKVRKRYLQYA
ncbi:hypothetical protein ADL22_05625 [Streptomyces sp. NRRL F-4489]|uniref:exo-beta-N-acetylmuramidase NamZ family protein n=1 Tax=Streptomyces sp. NRRL F-4489 TaxID=1609095 RepID=UPI00074A801B|nr:DUF1343 domain-containing protein [Streptomyces sp. NRRL F-4489]KUL52133.1 hypothetical protein ADL22_05625 [Streptomyces sp. NRRL F-4489]